LRLSKNNDKTEKYFLKFLEILKQLHANMSLTEVIAQISIYAKLFKDILSNRRRLEEVQVVSLNSNGSTLIMNELLKKLDDLGKFAVPYSIGNIQFKRVLCDLGASVSLTSKLVYERIKVGELKPT
jgi:hypothetical protein